MVQWHFGRILLEHLMKRLPSGTKVYGLMVMTNKTKRAICHEEILHFVTTQYGCRCIHILPELGRDIYKVTGIQVGVNGYEIHTELSLRNQQIWSSWDPLYWRTCGLIQICTFCLRSCNIYSLLSLHILKSLKYCSCRYKKHCFAFVFLFSSLGTFNNSILPSFFFQFSNILIIVFHFHFFWIFYWVWLLIMFHLCCCQTQFRVCDYILIRPY